MDVSPWADDERLLAALREAARAASAVPDELVEAGRAAFAWRETDAELAALVYDSAYESAYESAYDAAYDAAGDGGLVAVTRGAARVLIFDAGGERTIEAEVAPDALVGQLLPPVAGTVERQTPGGASVSAPIGADGGFALRPAPAGTFRLRCTCGELVLTTAWVPPAHPA
ncbi:hypothetical protein [Nonomuraea sp. NPDC050783]|uniref:hypothetical protein n=1 Tax=Nonomuraea sp. NPDC050783 TaxID=3154634 RepID=UPI00346562EE